MLPTPTGLERFLRVNYYHGEEPVKPDLKRGLYAFVTISRQYGAGGVLLAREIVTQLDRELDSSLHGWRVFDRELCEDLVGKEKNSVKLLLSEEYQSEVEALVLSLLGDSSAQPALLKRLFETIRTLATFGKVVIVGRAGSCITRNLPLGVHVRLHADPRIRMRRVGLDQMDSTAGRRLLESQDRRRAQLIRNHFHEEIDDPLLYDLVCNTGRLQIESVASLIVDLVKTKLRNERQLRRKEPAAPNVS